MTAPSSAWKFLHAAAPHYVAVKLNASEPIQLDGRLDEAAWNAADVEWTSPLVDITRHHQSAQNDVPTAFQARAKLRWDDEYLYVGVELNEPFIFANITGHNREVPYHDNDFEAFFDVSGSTHYYKEFEMSARNATYDVLWGVPDGESLACSAAAGAIVPVCVNTSFPGYAGSWSMASTRSRGLRSGGLAAATHFPPSQYGRYVSPHAIWSAEIAFPLRSDGAHGTHGGLLDGAMVGDTRRSYADHDPAHHPQTYWYFDLARAAHPRIYEPPTRGEPPATAPTSSEPPHRAVSEGQPQPPEAPALCPLSCTPELTSWHARLHPPSRAECATARERWPTLLGVDPWSCYWEWVYADVGPNAYMHRPLYWATLQFAQRRGGVSARCGAIEWPGRYLMRLAYVAQRAHMASGRGFTDEVATLVRACERAEGCEASDLRYALAQRDAFPHGLGLEMEPNATALRPDCAARPCFRAAVRVRVPKSGFAYTARIDSNSWLQVEWETRGERPCLF